MKKLEVLLAIFAVFAILSAGSVTHQVDMEFPELSRDNEYLKIEYNDCIMLSEEGEPLLPRKGISLLLPQNEVAENVNILDIEYYPVTETGMIEPASRPFPISIPAPADYSPQADEAIYGRDAIYPERTLSHLTTGFLSGHGIASLSFCPVEYNPVENTVRFIQSISFEIETSSSFRAREASANLKNNRKIANRIEKITENPELQQSYHYSENNMRPLEYDILLVTNSEFAPYFEDYIEFKESTGFSVALETTEEIYGNYTGVDQAAQVRACIVSYYQNYDIEYVILGGDAGNSNETAIVPHRGFAVDDEPSLPSDMYFSNLDGTWNNDGDGNWGEQNEIDPYAEVLIGRMCIDSASEVLNASDKHILYQNDPVVEDIEKAVMVGEELNNSPWTYGGDYKDQIVDGGTYDGYSTEGFSDNFDIDYYYDRDMTWDKWNLFDAFSDDGINLINHLGHSSPTYNMKMDTSDLITDYFTNNGLTRGFAIGYSQGCYNGSFDNYHYNGYYTSDCFAETMANTLPTGEVACIANSRYGWYMPGGTNSSSQYYDRMFFHGIFGEGFSEIGEVNRFSHEDDVSMMQYNSNMRWVCYQTNLFGDPSLDIWTEEPTDLTITHPVSLPIGISTIQLTSDTPNTRIGLTQNGELIGRGVTDEAGLLTIETFSPISSPGLISVSGIAHNKNRFMGTIVIVTDQPYVVLQAITVNDEAGNANGLIDYGETIELDLSLNNVGNIAASGVTASISTFDPTVTILNNSINCGNINGETVLVFDDAFSMQISDEVEDQHQVPFSLFISDDEGTNWNTTFNLVCNAPNLNCGLPLVDDSQGNNDGVIDAGESIVLSVPTSNLGNSATGELVSVLLSFDSWITINTVSQNGEALEPGEQSYLDFELDIDEDTPEGTVLNFTYSISSGSYGAEAEYDYTVGLVLEDFESGDFDTYPWSFNGNADWLIDDYAYNGQFSARSGTISNSQTSSMLIETWVRVDGEISFYKKVSCESDPDNHNFDWLAFYIDGTQMDRWDGEDPWSLETYDITEGLHTFEWRYRKDQYVSSGSDAGWIDYIIFPPMGPPPPPEMELSVSELDIEIQPESQTSEVITIENIGVGNLNYSVQVIETPERDLDDSYVICTTSSYSPGEDTGWIFELANNSNDGEEIVEVSLDFPEEVTVNIATGFYGGTNPLMPDGSNGAGAEIHWYAVPGLLPGEDSTCGVNLSVSSDLTGEVQIPYEIIGSDGTELSGIISLYSLGIGWCNLSHNTGMIETYDSDNVTIFFNSEGLTYGSYHAEIIFSDGSEEINIPVTMTIPNTPAENGDIPQVTEFTGAYPNPFNPETMLKFKLAQSCNIKLDIFNTRGQLVSQLVNDHYSPGEYQVPWNGIDRKGRQVSSGIYFCRFTARADAGRPDGNNNDPGDYTTVTKIALMK